MKGLKFKHLSFEDRVFIQGRLDMGSNFAAIARGLHKDRTTISKEVYRGRYVLTKTDRYPSCPKNSKAPYVCNGCERKEICKLKQYRYEASIAHNEYRYHLVNSRNGYRIDKDIISSINEVISPLIINNHHSIYQVYQNHKEILNFSKGTFYRYIDAGLLNVRNIDLPRKVKFKVKKKPDEIRAKVDPKIKLGRFYRDFQTYLDISPDTSVVEMDTVIGTMGGKGGKCLLTLLFRKCKVMLIYLLPYKKSKYVNEVFDNLKAKLGSERFSKLFEVILTDNGSEFSDPERVEFDPETGEKLCNLFYCEPNHSWQKGMIEKNHEFIRYVLPKGTSFAGLTQEDCYLLANHINSVPRESLNGHTPIELARLILNEKDLETLCLRPIPADKVKLAPSLLKKLSI